MQINNPFGYGNTKQPPAVVPQRAYTWAELWSQQTQAKDESCTFPPPRELKCSRGKRVTPFALNSEIVHLAQEHGGVMMLAQKLTQKCPNVQQIFSDKDSLREWDRLFRGKHGGPKVAGKSAEEWTTAIRNWMKERFEKGERGFGSCAPRVVGSGATRTVTKKNLKEQLARGKTVMGEKLHACFARGIDALEMSCSDVDVRLKIYWKGKGRGICPEDYNAFFEGLDALMRQKAGDRVELKISRVRFKGNVGHVYKLKDKQTGAEIDIAVYERFMDPYLFFEDCIEIYRFFEKESRTHKICVDYRDLPWYYLLSVAGHFAARHLQPNTHCFRNLIGREYKRGVWTTNHAMSEEMLFTWVNERLQRFGNHGSPLGAMYADVQSTIESHQLDAETFLLHLQTRLFFSSGTTEKSNPEQLIASVIELLPSGTRYPILRHVIEAGRARAQFKHAQAWLQCVALVALIEGWSEPFEIEWAHNCGRRCLRLALQIDGNTRYIWLPCTPQWALQCLETIGEHERLNQLLARQKVSTREHSLGYRKRILDEIPEVTKLLQEPSDDPLILRLAIGVSSLGELVPDSLSPQKIDRLPDYILRAACQQPALALKHLPWVLHLFKQQTKVKAAALEPILVEALKKCEWTAAKELLGHIKLGRDLALTCITQMAGSEEQIELELLQALATHLHPKLNLGHWRSELRKQRTADLACRSLMLYFCDPLSGVDAAWLADLVLQPPVLLQSKLSSFDCLQTAAKYSDERTLDLMDAFKTKDASAVQQFMAQWMPREPGKHRGALERFVTVPKGPLELKDVRGVADLLERFEQLDALPQLFTCVQSEDLRAVLLALPAQDGLQLLRSNAALSETLLAQLPPQQWKTLWPELPRHMRTAQLAKGVLQRVPEKDFDTLLKLHAVVDPTGKMLVEIDRLGPLVTHCVEQGRLAAIADLLVSQFNALPSEIQVNPAVLLQLHAAGQTRLVWDVVGREELETNAQTLRLLKALLAGSNLDATRRLSVLQKYEPLFCDSVGLCKHLVPLRINTLPLWQRCIKVHGVNEEVVTQLQEVFKKTLRKEVGNLDASLCTAVFDLAQSALESNNISVALNLLAVLSSRRGRLEFKAKQQLDALVVRCGDLAIQTCNRWKAEAVLSQLQLGGDETWDAFCSYLGRMQATFDLKSKSVSKLIQTPSAPLSLPTLRQYITLFAKHGLTRRCMALFEHLKGGDEKRLLQSMQPELAIRLLKTSGGIQVGLESLAASSELDLAVWRGLWPNIPETMRSDRLVAALFKRVPSKRLKQRLGMQQLIDPDGSALQRLGLLDNLLKSFDAKGRLAELSDLLIAQYAQLPKEWTHHPAVLLALLEAGETAPVWKAVESCTLGHSAACLPIIKSYLEQSKLGKQRKIKVLKHYEAHFCAAGGLCHHITKPTTATAALWLRCVKQHGVGSDSATTFKVAFAAAFRPNKKKKRGGNRALDAQLCQVALQLSEALLESQEPAAALSVLGLLHLQRKRLKGSLRSRVDALHQRCGQQALQQKDVASAIEALGRLKDAGGEMEKAVRELLYGILKHSPKMQKGEDGRAVARAYFSLQDPSRMQFERVSHLLTLLPEKERSGVLDRIVPELQAGGIRKLLLQKVASGKKEDQLWVAAGLNDFRAFRGFKIQHVRQFWKAWTANKQRAYPTCLDAAIKLLPDSQYEPWSGPVTALLVVHFQHKAEKEARVARQLLALFVNATPQRDYFLSVGSVLIPAVCAHPVNSYADSEVAFNDVFETVHAAFRLAPELGLADSPKHRGCLMQMARAFQRRAHELSSVYACMILDHLMLNKFPCADFYPLVERASAAPDTFAYKRCASLGNALERILAELKEKGAPRVQLKPALFMALCRGTGLIHKERALRLLQQAFQMNLLGDDHWERIWACTYQNAIFGRVQSFDREVRDQEIRGYIEVLDLAMQKYFDPRLFLESPGKRKIVRRKVYVSMSPPKLSLDPFDGYGSLVDPQVREMDLRIQTTSFMTSLLTPLVNFILVTREEKDSNDELQELVIRKLMKCLLFLSPRLVPEKRKAEYQVEVHCVNVQTVAAGKLLVLLHRDMEKIKGKKSLELSVDLLQFLFENCHAKGVLGEGRDKVARLIVQQRARWSRMKDQ